MFVKVIVPVSSSFVPVQFRCRETFRFRFDGSQGRIGTFGQGQCRASIVGCRQQFGIIIQVFCDCGFATKGA